MDSKIIYSSVASLALVFGLVGVVQAAAPDGVGPWADEVISFTQGTKKNGSSVAASRSNPSAALGVAEGTNGGGTFVSLGFGGELVLRFDTPVSNGVAVVEATNGSDYPDEKVQVELSEDGVNYVNAGVVTFDGATSTGEVCARFVRLTDVTDSSIHNGSADGYDVDGVRVEGEPCEAPVVPFFGGPAVVALAGAGSVFGWKKFIRG